METKSLRGFEEPHTKKRQKQGNKGRADLITRAMGEGSSEKGTVGIDREQ